MKIITIIGVLILSLGTSGIAGEPSAVPFSEMNVAVNLSEPYGVSKFTVTCASESNGKDWKIKKMVLETECGPIVVPEKAYSDFINPSWPEISNAFGDLWVRFHGKNTVHQVGTGVTIVIKNKKVVSRSFQTMKESVEEKF